MAAAVDHERAGYFGGDREEDARTTTSRLATKKVQRSTQQASTQKQNAATVAGVDDTFELFDPAVYKPENCRGIAQKLLVGMVMLQLKRYDESTDGNGELPPSFFVYVQGNPDGQDVHDTAHTQRDPSSNGSGGLCSGGGTNWHGRQSHSRQNNSAGISNIPEAAGSTNRLPVHVQKAAQTTQQKNATCRCDMPFAKARHAAGGWWWECRRNRAG